MFPVLTIPVCSGLWRSFDQSSYVYLRSWNINKAMIWIFGFRKQTVNNKLGEEHKNTRWGTVDYPLIYSIVSPRPIFLTCRPEPYGPSVWKQSMRSGGSTPRFQHDFSGNVRQQFEAAHYDHLYGIQRVEYAPCKHLYFCPMFVFKHFPVERCTPDSVDIFNLIVVTFKCTLKL